MHRVIWMPTENPTGNERGGRVGACFGHSPCLLLNLGALPFFFSVSGGGLTASYLQVIQSHLLRHRHRQSICRAPLNPQLFRSILLPASADIASHGSWSVSFVGSLRFGQLKEGIIQPGDGHYTPFNHPSSSSVTVEFGVILLYLEAIPSRSNSILHYYSRMLFRWHYYVRGYSHYLLPRLFRLVWLR